ncbi:MAG: hypothetical protein IKU83_01970 [Lachnospiraceae bacterium]|nr:hypothetical protein [Lachnospiraceae bacterium]
MKKSVPFLLLILALSLSFCIVSQAENTQTLTLSDGEDRTFLGYNTSMNFWYVGGEVAYSSSDISISALAPLEQCSLILQVKSPVTDAVDVVARITTADGSYELKSDWLAQPGAGNQVSIDLSSFSGQTVDLEVVYVWDQSSLITIRLLPPHAQLCYSKDTLAITLLRATMQKIFPCFTVFRSLFSAVFP